MTSNTEPELALIRALAREPAPSLPEDVELGGLDFGLLSQELDRRWLLPLLGTRLIAAIDGERIPPSFRQAVEQRLAEWRQDSKRKEIITWGLLAALEQRGVRSLPLKGPYLARRLHGDVGMRFSQDLDLLVKPTELPQAIEVLERAGWVRPRQGNSLPTLHHILVHPQGPPIDLHWRIHWYRGTYAEGMLERSGVVDGQRTPAPVDDLVSLLLFYARDGLLGLRFPVDIATWRSSWGERLEAIEVQAILERHPDIARPVRAAAMSVDRWLGLDLERRFFAGTTASRRVVGAVSLSACALRLPSPEIGARQLVVDTLLAEPGGVLRSLRRKGLPRLDRPTLVRPFFQTLHLLALLLRSLPVLARTTPVLLGRRAPD